MDHRDKNVENNELSREVEDLSDFVKEGYAALMPTIRASNSLPKGSQWDLFCTSPYFKPIMGSLGNKTLDLMSQILRHQGLYRDIKSRDVEEKYELVIEANDKMLEKVGTHLDELSGIRRNPSAAVSNVAVTTLPTASGSWNRNVASSAVWKEVRVTKNSQTPVVLRNARVTQRPQVKFADKIDNSSTPFVPRIKEKPNSLKPLAILFEEVPGEDPCYSHPYEFELERFQDRVDRMDLSRKQPQKPKPVSETPLIMVTQEEELMEMLAELRTQREIAVDLEHHSYRTFQGFTCLMQISTRDKDYLVDTLDLRHKLYVLNEVFTDPNICKVFHGADSDVLWLQRDLCLYVVNMFDTYQAALLLSLPRLSLAFLLKKFCNVDANKSFQLYDWRTRPLPEEAVKYAREDTHYLLYICDMLWNELLEKSSGGLQMLQSVIFRSADTCKKRYWKDIFKEDSYEMIYRKSKKNFDNRQMYALKELFAWRDRTAREEDESTGYVLPNHMLLLIAEKLPKEMQGITACCNPIPPLVRQNLVFLHQTILRAREQPLVVRLSSTVNSSERLRPVQQSSVNLEGALHCPHDLTHSQDFRDDLPTLLGGELRVISCNDEIMEQTPPSTVFTEHEKENHEKLHLPNQIHFMSPFDRYKRIVAFIEEEEKRNKDKEEEVQRDTQKLLDECLRERHLAALSSNGDLPTPDVEVKQEKKDEGLASRKRRREEDNSVEESPSLISINDALKRESENISMDDSQLTGESRQPRKRKKTNLMKEKDTEELVIPMKVQIGNKPKNGHFNQSQQKSKTSSGEFTQFDYSQVDYSQYQQGEQGATPRNSRDKFKQRGKKKQQNKSFTFAMQYGGGSSKKGKS